MLIIIEEEDSLYMKESSCEIVSCHAELREHPELTTQSWFMQSLVRK